VACEKRIVPAIPVDDVESLSRLLAGDEGRQEEEAKDSATAQAIGDAKPNEKTTGDKKIIKQQVTQRITDPVTQVVTNRLTYP